MSWQADAFQNNATPEMFNQLLVHIHKLPLSSLIYRPGTVVTGNERALSGQLEIFTRAPFSIFPLSITIYGAVQRKLEIFQTLFIGLRD